MQQYLWRGAWMGILLLTAGCGDRALGVRSWGSVSYLGESIETGQIVFSPIEGTPGPSTGGTIAHGKYDIAKQVGPYAGGTYRVEITAYGRPRTYNPNVSAQGTLVTVPVQLLPAKYNRSSTLRANISDSASAHQQDFDLAG